MAEGAWLLVLVRLRVQVIGMFMLALWVLATHHAALELTGLFAHGGVAVAHTSAGDSSDAGLHPWHQVEKNLTKQKTGLPTKPVSLQHELPIFEIFVGEPVPIVRPIRIEEEVHLLRSWHFVQRAAPQPGAPSALV